MKGNSVDDTRDATIARRKRRIFDMNHNTFLKRTYGITVKDYKRMLEEQNFSCAICGNSDAGMPQSKYNIFHVDHNHNTGHVRGLLCRSCNSIVLVAVEHYESRLIAAKNYLQRPIKVG